MKILVTLTGPSCSGKSTLEKRLVSEGCASALSITTRSPREGEVDGVHYRFVSKSQFKKLKEQGALAESTLFNENHYGVEKSELENAFRRSSAVVLVVEPNGAQEIKKTAKEQGWECLSLFIDGPTDLVAARFLRRLASELAVSTDMEKVLNSYSKRLTAIMTIEHGWRVDAHTERVPYDLLFLSFCGPTEREVIDAIVSRLARIKDRSAA